MDTAPSVRLRCQAREAIIAGYVKCMPAAQRKVILSPQQQHGPAQKPTRVKGESDRNFVLVASKFDPVDPKLDLVGF